MKKTKLLSVLVGGALTVGLAVGLGGCSSSGSNDGGQKTAKVNPNKIHFTDKEISKYLKFVPNKNTKKTYAGILYKGTWGKLVIDSPYKKLNGTVKVLKGKMVKVSEEDDPENGPYTDLEGTTPQVGDHINAGQMLAGKTDANYAFDNYFDKKGVTVDAGKDYEHEIYVSIKGPKDANKLDWSEFIQKYPLGKNGTRKPINFIGNNGKEFVVGNVTKNKVMYVDELNYTDLSIENNKPVLNKISVSASDDFNLTLKNDGHATYKDGTFNTLDDVKKATHSLSVLYNGTDLK